MSRAFTRGSGLTRTLACAAAVLLTWASATVAGEVRFTASVDQTTVGLGEQFQLVLSVEGEDMLSAPSPVLPALAAFEVLGRSSSQSTNISLIGGQLKKQATVSFIYVLAARQLGTAVIPAATLKYEGKEYQSQPIEMTVVKAAQGQATPMPGGANAPQAPSRIPLEGNLFLSVTPSRRTAYVGEPITVDILLCSRFQVESGGWAELPTFDGFWAEKVFEASRFDFERRTIEGRAFGVAELKKVMLFPLTAGDVTIKPMAFNVSVAQAPRDFFDMLGSSQTVRVDSKPLALKILPLPEKDRPAEFTGGVGQFTLEAALDRTSTTNGEPVNLTVRVSGSGNVRMIDPPTIASNPGLKILSAETKDDVHVTVDGARGTKTFRFPIIPQSDGRFELPPIAMAYFDPQARAYRRLASGPLAFTATGSATIAPVTEASGLKVLGNDIAYIKPDATGLSSMPMDAPWWPNAMALASLGVAGLALGYRGHRERLESDRGYARKTRSTALVRRRLHQAEQLLKKRDERGFHAELSRAVLGYLGDRFNLDTHALTRDQLRTGLAERAVAPETIDAVLGIVDRCEVARFSPDDAGGRDPRALFDSVRDVLARV